METDQPVPNADLIRAALDGKTVQHFWNGKWTDEDPKIAVSRLAQWVTGDGAWRLKPEPLVSWHDVFENGYVSGGYATRDETGGEDGVKRLLRVELDPDTLDVIDAKTEAP